MAVANNLILFRYWTNTRCIATKKHFGLLLLLFAFIIAFLFSVSFGIWTKKFGFQLPIPFQQWIIAFVALLILSVVTWALVPKQWRRSKEFRKRFPFFVANTFCQYIATFVFTGLGYLFLSVPDGYQWILAIMLPLVRETNILIQEILAQKSAGGKDTSVTIASSHIVNTRYSVFLSVMVGTIANDLSSSIMLLSDFIFNLYLATKIIWIKKMRLKNDTNDFEMVHLLFLLTINELVEIVIPLTFLLCFLSAYFGPNAEIIGGVKSTHFHYEPITDIHGFIKKMMLFLIVDIMSVIAVGLVLWTSCKINLFRAYMTMLNEFWPIITMTTGFVVYGVIVNNSSI